MYSFLPVPHNVFRSIHTDTHSGLLDLFANSIREQQLTHEAEESMKGGDADEIEETDLDMQI